MTDYYNKKEYFDLVKSNLNIFLHKLLLQQKENLETCMYCHNFLGNCRKNCIAQWMEFHMN